MLAGVLSTGPISALLLSVPPPSLPWQTRQLRAKMCAPRSESRSKTSLAASVRRPLSNHTYAPSDATASTSSATIARICFSVF